MRISDWGSDVCSSDLTTRSGVLFISTLAWTGPLACSCRSLARPSQNCAALHTAFSAVGELRGPFRSEERRVGKESARKCRSRRSPYHYNHNKHQAHTSKEKS